MDRGTPLDQAEDARRVRVVTALRVLPAFGETELRRISTTAVRGWVTSMVEEGLSPARTRQALQVLHTSLDVAVDDGLIARNPTDRVKPPGAEASAALPHRRPGRETR